MIMALIAGALVATNAAASSSAASSLPADAGAAELVRSCRTMVPSDVDISGRIVLRNRRGIVQAEYGYALSRRAGETSLRVTDAKGGELEYPKQGPMLGTDVTWSDITLEYLWWDDFAFDAERESETVHGQKCSVLLMKKRGDGDKVPDRAVRVWVDRKTGAMMQAEEIVDGKTARRLWGTRVKKFGDRWAPNVLEVETLGSGHRTKITVEDLK